MPKVVAAFSSDGVARAAAEALGNERKGDRIAVVSEAREVTFDGVTVGAGVGSLLGLVASTGALGIPGIGPFLAMGPLAATLGGATAGGLAGLFVDARIPDHPPVPRLEGVTGNHAAVVVDTSQAARVESLLRAQGALTVRTFDEGGTRHG